MTDLNSINVGDDVTFTVRGKVSNAGDGFGYVILAHPTKGFTAGSVIDQVDCLSFEVHEPEPVWTDGDAIRYSNGDYSCIYGRANGKWYEAGTSLSSGTDAGMNLGLRHYPESYKVVHQEVK